MSLLVPDIKTPRRESHCPTLLVPLLPEGIVLTTGEDIRPSRDPGARRLLKGERPDDRLSAYADTLETRPGVSPFGRKGTSAVALIHDHPLERVNWRNWAGDPAADA